MEWKAPVMRIASFRVYGHRTNYDYVASRKVKFRNRVLNCYVLDSTQNMTNRIKFFLCMSQKVLGKYTFF